MGVSIQKLFQTIVLFKPGDCAIYPVLKFCAWFESSGLGQCGRVGISLIHIAGLHGKELLACFSADGIFDARDIIHKFGGTLIAYVVDTVRCR